MEKFITAAGCALRIYYTSWRKREVSHGRTDNLLPEETATTQAVSGNIFGDSAPVVLLLHGYLESLDVWAEFIPVLENEGINVIAIDIPGHGISEVKGEIHTMDYLSGIAAGVLDVLGVEKCIVAGHSMGGYVACACLRNYPERLAGLALLHSTPNPDTEEKKTQRRREIELVRAGKKDLLATTVEKGFAANNRKKYRDFIEALRDQVVLTDEDGIIALLNGMMERADCNETLVGSPVPQLMVFGLKDEYIPEEAARKLAEKHSQAQFAWLSESGHMGFVEEPQKTLEALVDFIGNTGNK